MAMSSKASGAIGGAAQGAAAGANFGPWGAVIGGALGGLSGLLGGGGEDEAKKLARRQAALIRATTQENMRVMGRQMEQDVGMARAATGASNVTFSGSSQRFIGEMENEWRRSIAWEQASGNMKARLARMGGQVAAERIQASSMASMMGGLASFATSGLAGSYSKDTGYKWDPWGK